jgi:L-aminopeptidase/D-esterase-like protein
LYDSAYNPRIVMNRLLLVVAGGFFIVAMLQAQGTPEPSGITAVPGVRVGHFTRPERPTGCTVILLPPDTVGAVDQRGGAPGTAETDLLRPENTVSVVHAVLLTGGSAFGLDARGGVMKYLEEQKIGFAFGGAYVPIVPAAVLFDLRVGGRPEIRPDAQCGYEAARRASAGAVEEGSVGAGAGATVGKTGDPARPMKGGVGTAALHGPGGLIVGALVAVNAAGTVMDRRTGAPLAGRLSADGRVEDPSALVRSGELIPGAPLENTTLAVVATNARLTKAQALKVAQMAQDGLARSIVPSHTTNDGDTLFAFGTGTLAGDAEVSRIGAMAAEAVSDAIERGVRLAKGVAGIPALSDLK